MCSMRVRFHIGYEDYKLHPLITRSVLHRNMQEQNVHVYLTADIILLTHLNTH